MIIKQIYQGRREISTIYLNNVIIWKSYKTLSIGYNIYLTTNDDIDGVLTGIILKDILQGNIICNIGENNDNNFNPINIHNCKYDVVVDPTGSIDQNYILMLDIVSCYGENVPLSNISEFCNCTTVSIQNVFYTFDVGVQLINILNGFVANSVRLFHNSNHNVSMSEKYSMFTAFAVLASHGSSIKLDIRSILNGSDPYAVTSGYRNNFMVEILYINDAVSAIVRSSTHDTDLDAYDSSILYIANVKLKNGLYDASIGAYSTDILNIDVPSIVSYYKNNYLLIDETEENNFLTSQLDLINKFIILTPVDITDNNSLAVKTIQLYKNDKNNIIDTIDGNIMVNNIVHFLYFVNSDFVDIIEGDSFVAPIKSGYLYDSATNLESLLNMTEIEIQNMKFDNIFTFTEDSDRNSMSISTILHNYDKEVSINEDDILDIQDIHFACGSCDITHSFDISTEAYLNADIQQDYMYPIQTNTDLYIPQIFTTIQNGANLNFSKNNT